MAERAQRIASFLAASGWAGVTHRPLAGDASFRRYHRLASGERRAVLMDAPPPQEDVGPYVVVAGLLRRLGFSAPEVLAEDHEKGFLLLEDFGDDTYTRLLDRGFDEPAPYLFAGIQLLHRRLFADPPGRIFSLVRLFDRAEAAGRLRAIEHDGQWFHVGTPQGLAETRKRLG